MSAVKLRDEAVEESVNLSEQGEGILDVYHIVFHQVMWSCCALSQSPSGCDCDP